MFPFLAPSSTKTPYNVCFILPKWVLPTDKNMETKWSGGHVLFQCWMLSAVRAAMWRALSQLYCTDMNSITEACCSQEGNPDTCIPLWCLLKRAALDLPHAQGMTCNLWEACSLCKACPFLSHLHTPFIKDSLLLSECLASLSWVFIREFNRQASFTKTPYKKILKMLRYAYKNMHN